MKSTSRMPLHHTSGTAAASVNDRFLGSGMTKPSGAAAYSAYPPPSRSANTLSPFLNLLAPSPVSTTTPAASRPKISLAPACDQDDHVCATCAGCNCHMATVCYVSQLTGVSCCMNVPPCRQGLTRTSVQHQQCVCSNGSSPEVDQTLHGATCVQDSVHLM